MKNISFILFIKCSRQDARVIANALCRLSQEVLTDWAKVLNDWAKVLTDWAKVLNDWAKVLNDWAKVLTDWANVLTTELWC
jgi:hypothetical protein